MPRSRVTYRDPSTGRFISAADALDSESYVRTTYVDNVLSSQQVFVGGELESDVYGEFQNWQAESSRWGTRWHADESPLDLAALRQTDFPSDADSFKVWYFVDGNPDYPRGYASGGWMGADQWPPSLDRESFPANGISQIVFRRE